LRHSKVSCHILKNLANAVQQLHNRKTFGVSNCYEVNTFISTGLKFRFASYNKSLIFLWRRNPIDPDWCKNHALFRHTWLFLFLIIDPCSLSNISTFTSHNLIGKHKSPYLLFLSIWIALFVVNHQLLIRFLFFLESFRRKSRPPFLTHSALILYKLNWIFLFSRDIKVALIYFLKMELTKQVSVVVRLSTKFLKLSSLSAAKLCSFASTVRKPSSFVCCAPPPPPPPPPSQQ